MLITEAQMDIRKSNLGILDEMVYLGESVYSPAMVPIVESSAAQANLIRLEDMMAFSEANCIEDLGYALQLVCEADNVDPSTIAFTVKATNVIANEDVADITKGIMEAGVPIYALPINENAVEAQIVDFSVNQLMEGNSEFIDALAECDLSIFTEEEKVKVVRAFDTKNEIAQGRRQNAAKDAEKKRANDRVKFGDAEGLSAKVNSIWEKVKSGAYAGRNALAGLLDRLNAWMRNIQDDIAKNPEKKGILTSIKGKIASVIQAITQKLHDFVQKDRGNIGERPNPLNAAKAEEKK